jgi:methylmalonyl-CoA mutase N-terminal domain/subunit
MCGGVCSVLPVLAFYIVAAEEQGVPQAQLQVGGPT